MIRLFIYSSTTGLLRENDTLNRVKFDLMITNKQNRFIYQMG
jgi:hypothetical protein